MRFLASVLTVFGVLFAVPSVTGHSGQASFIVVPIDHVNPGQPFEVIAADLGANAQVMLSMARQGTTMPLATVSADGEGHFSTSVSLPPDYPEGYAELVAAGDDGSRASTWVLVGPRTAFTAAPPGQVAWWQDPSVIVLIALVVGTFAVVGFMLVRRVNSLRSLTTAPRSSRPSGHTRRKRRRSG